MSMLHRAFIEGHDCYSVALRKVEQEARNCRCKTARPHIADAAANITAIWMDEDMDDETLSVYEDLIAQSIEDAKTAIRKHEERR